MRADLERLLISEAALVELTGFDRQKVLLSNKLTSQQITVQRAIALGVFSISFISLASIFFPTLQIAGVIFLVGLILGGVSLVIEFAELTVLFFCLVLGSAIYAIYILAAKPLGLILLCLGCAIASGAIALLLTKLIIKQWQKSKKIQKQRK